MQSPQSITDSPPNPVNTTTITSSSNNNNHDSSANNGLLNSSIFPSITSNSDSLFPTRQNVSFASLLKYSNKHVLNDQWNYIIYHTDIKNYK